MLTANLLDGHITTMPNVSRGNCSIRCLVKSKDNVFNVAAKRCSAQGKVSFGQMLLIPEGQVTFELICVYNDGTNEPVGQSVCTTRTLQNSKLLVLTKAEKSTATIAITCTSVPKGPALMRDREENPPEKKPTSKHVKEPRAKHTNPHVRTTQMTVGYVHSQWPDPRQFEKEKLMYKLSLVEQRKMDTLKELQDKCKQREEAVHRKLKKRADVRRQEEEECEARAAAALRHELLEREREVRQLEAQVHALEAHPPVVAGAEWGSPAPASTRTTPAKPPAPASTRPSPAKSPRIADKVAARTQTPVKSAAQPPKPSLPVTSVKSSAARNVAGRPHVSQAKIHQYLAERGRNSTVFSKKYNAETFAQAERASKEVEAAYPTLRMSTVAPIPVRPERTFRVKPVVSPEIKDDLGKPVKKHVAIPLRTSTGPKGPKVRSLADASAAKMAAHSKQRSQYQYGKPVYNPTKKVSEIRAVYSRPPSGGYASIRSSSAPAARPVPGKVAGISGVRTPASGSRAEQAAPSRLATSARPITQVAQKETQRQRPAESMRQRIDGLLETDSSAPTTTTPTGATGRRPTRLSNKTVPRVAQPKEAPVQAKEQPAPATIKAVTEPSSAATSSSKPSGYTATSASKPSGYTGSHPKLFAELSAPTVKSPPRVTGTWRAAPPAAAVSPKRLVAPTTPSYAKDSKKSTATENHSVRKTAPKSSTPTVAERKAATKTATPKTSTPKGSGGAPNPKVSERELMEANIAEAQRRKKERDRALQLDDFRVLDAIDLMEAGSPIPAAAPMSVPVIAGSKTKVANTKSAEKPSSQKSGGGSAGFMATSTPPRSNSKVITMPSTAQLRASIDRAEADELQSPEADQSVDSLTGVAGARIGEAAVDISLSPLRSGEINPGTEEFGAAGVSAPLLDALQQISAANRQGGGPGKHSGGVTPVRAALLHDTIDLMEAGSPIPAAAPMSVPVTAGSKTKVTMNNTNSTEKPSSQKSGGGSAGFMATSTPPRSNSKVITMPSTAQLRASIDRAEADELQSPEADQSVDSLTGVAGARIGEAAVDISLSPLRSGEITPSAAGVSAPLLDALQQISAANRQGGGAGKHTGGVTPVRAALLKNLNAASLGGGTAAGGDGSNSNGHSPSKQHKIYTVSESLALRAAEKASGSPATSGNASFASDSNTSNISVILSSKLASPSLPPAPNTGANNSGMSEVSDELCMDESGAESEPEDEVGADSSPLQEETREDVVSQRLSGILSGLDARIDGIREKALDSSPMFGRGGFKSQASEELDAEEEGFLQSFQTGVEGEGYGDDGASEDADEDEEGFLPSFRTGIEGGYEDEDEDLSDAGTGCGDMNFASDDESVVGLGSETGSPDIHAFDAEHDDYSINSDDMLGAFGGADTANASLDEVPKVEWGTDDDDIANFLSQRLGRPIPASVNESALSGAGGSHLGSDSDGELSSEGTVPSSSDSDHSDSSLREFIESSTKMVKARRRKKPEVLSVSEDVLSGPDGIGSFDPNNNSRSGRRFDDSDTKDEEELFVMEGNFSLNSPGLV